MSAEDGSPLARRPRDRSAPRRSGQFEYPTYDYVTPAEQRAGRIGRHPVVVVGGGLAGLTAATDLGVRGVPCVLLDDNNTVSAGSRSIGQAKRSLEIWDRLGCGDRMLAMGRSWSKGNILRGDKLLFAFGLSPEGERKFPAFLTLPQYYIETFLAQRCAAFPQIELRWLNRVVGASQTDDHVRLDIETPDGVYGIEADWVIAADGVRSTMRRCLDVPFEGRGFVDRFVIADVKVSTSFPPQRMFWFEPRFIDSRLALLHQQPEGIWRVDWQLNPEEDAEEAADPEKARARLAKVFGPEVDFEIQEISVYTFDVRRVPAFRQGRVMFAGDAAHQLSPFGGGRGGNSGVQDIDNLVWKLALVLDGKAPDTLLDSYNAERVPVADENMALSYRSAEFITPTSAPSAALRDAVLRLAPAVPFARSFINTGRLSVAATLRASPLVTPDADEWAGPLAPGDAPADGPVRTATGDADWLVRNLTGGFTLMLHVERETEMAEAVGTALAALADDPVPVATLILVSAQGERPGDATLADETGQLRRLYDLTPGACVLFRPDQHIAARWRAFDIEAVRGAVRRACGESVT